MNWNDSAYQVLQLQPLSTRFILNYNPIHAPRRPRSSPCPVLGTSGLKGAQVCYIGRTTRAAQQILPDTIDPFLPPGSRLPNHSLINYRTDVDGLRGLAVLLVVAFHASDSRVPGGFVGVDVFFVISGYLITGILMREMHAGHFNVARFYARRVRRLFPALLIVLAAAWFAGLLVLFPFEFKELGKHVSAGVGFVSNLALWQESGYFDLDGEFKPLLHLWSLGIEEQFYIAWPPLLWLAARRGRALECAAIIVIASLAANLWELASDPAGAFYLPYTRAWELLIGAWLALDEYDRKRVASTQSSMARTGSAFAGLALILFSAFLFDRNSAYPGWRALCPTIGTLMLIAAGPGNWINRRILGHPYLVWIGLISYPLYLWHWPLLFFTKSLTTGSPGVIPRLCAVSIAIVLAWLTYILVEKPIRNGRLRHSISILAAASIVCLSLGLLAWNGVGLQPRLQKYDADLRDISTWPGIWSATPGCAQTISGASQYCVRVPEGESPSVLLLGDSHSNHLLPGLAAVIGPGKGAILNLGGSGCLPLLSDSASPSVDSCGPAVAAAFNHLFANENLRTVILAAAWRNRLSGTDDGQIRARFEATLTRLKEAGKRVIFVHDVPNFSFHVRACFNEQRYALTPLVIDCGVPIARVVEEQRAYRALIGSVLNRHLEVMVVDPVQAPLCSPSRCNAVAQGRIFMRDRDHLSVTGSLALTPLFVESLGHAMH